MTEPAKPLACPFCGKPATTYRPTALKTLVSCPNPECPGHSVDATEHEWNTRAADPRLAELRAIAEGLYAYWHGARGNVTIEAPAAFTEWKARNPE